MIGFLVCRRPEAYRARQWEVLPPRKRYPLFLKNLEIFLEEAVELLRIN